MSQYNEEKIRTEPDNPCTNKPCDTISQILAPKEKDIGGFSVRRAIPSIQRKQVGPFVFFDHLGPAEFAPGNGINVRAHPHIGLATITYLFEGELFHKDSLGNELAITPGAINLMVAGKGIVHAEKTRPEVRQSGQKIEALQLWIALPKEEEDREPSFTHFEASKIPEVSTDGANIRVMMGEAFGVKSPVDTFSDTIYLEVRIKEGSSITLPDAEERAVYVLRGKVKTNGVVVQAYQMAILEKSPGITLEATEDSTFALIGGATLGHRYLFWNLVSTDPEKIEKAKQDWKNGLFASVPGETDFIPLPE